ncbi:hypothetical protein [Brevibacillus reuszeri]|uniref:hypothetical protein n=1 Tax=Brevibacillus reuszeri TaxID=54915 RepID=UPI0028A078F5|nr:hypothetical protein [Brevibacillus reuszeri]
MKKLVTAALALTLLFGSATGVFAATVPEIEPNNTWEQAQPITIGSTITAHGDEDRFTFVATKSGTVTLKITLNGNPALFASRVYDDQMNALGESTFGGSITFNVAAGRTYKLAHLELMSSGTPYSFTLSYN